MRRTLTPQARVVWSAFFAFLLVLNLKNADPFCLSSFVVGWIAYAILDQLSLALVTKMTKPEDTGRDGP